MSRSDRRPLTPSLAAPDPRASVSSVAIRGEPFRAPSTRLLDLESRYKLVAERDSAARLTAIDAVLRQAIPELELQAALSRQS